MSSLKNIIKKNDVEIKIDENKSKEFVKQATGENRITNPKGRPKIKNELEKRDKNIILYLTQNEKDILTDKAKKAGVSVSRFIVSMAIQKD